MIELFKEFGMAILWLFLGYLVEERAAAGGAIRRMVQEEDAFPF